jgi:hypothetical protein
VSRTAKVVFREKEKQKKQYLRYLRRASNQLVK